MIFFKKGLMVKKEYTNICSAGFVIQTLFGRELHSRIVERSNLSKFCFHFFAHVECFNEIVN